MENNYQYHVIAKAINFLRDNYEQQPSLEEAAAAVNLSKYHFQRTFKKWVGISPKDFLQYTTLEHAKKVLQEGQSTARTAYEVGLSGNSRLHDLFVKIESCTPGEFQGKGAGLRLRISEFETPFGQVAMLETDRGIANLSFGSKEELQSMPQYQNAVFSEGTGEHGEAVKRYFSTWEIPSRPIQLYLAGTSFQVQVWKALLQVPTGSLAAYQDLAEAIQRPRAVRAVGTAIGKNPVAYLIPCHRVVKNNGEFGNYRWDPDRKVIAHAYESVMWST